MSALLRLAAALGLLVLALTATVNAEDRRFLLATTTSTPCRLSSRIVASLICGASTCWAQPLKRAMRARRGPEIGGLAPSVVPVQAHVPVHDTAYRTNSRGSFGRISMWKWFRWPSL